MNKNEFTTAALALGWTRDAYGHLKHTSPKTGALYRIKLQKLAWRLESQSVLPATQYSKASKLWCRSKGGYYAQTTPEQVPAPPGRTAPTTPPVVSPPVEKPVIAPPPPNLRPPWEV